jgi:hypothetical protein
MGDFRFNHSSLPDQPDSEYDMKAIFDSRGEDLKIALNNLIDALMAVTASANIGSNAISGVDGSTIYDQLVSLKSQITQQVLGQLPDGSVTIDKLAFTPAVADDIANITANFTNNPAPSKLLYLNANSKYSADILDSVVVSALTDGAIGDISEELAANCSQYDLVYLSSTGYNKAQANADATLPCVGLALATGNNSVVKILKRGLFKKTGSGFKRTTCVCFSYYSRTINHGQAKRNGTATAGCGLCGRRKYNILQPSIPLFRAIEVIAWHYTDMMYIMLSPISMSVVTTTHLAPGIPRAVAMQT